MFVWWLFSGIMLAVFYKLLLLVSPASFASPASSTSPAYSSSFASCGRYIWSALPQCAASLDISRLNLKAALAAALEADSFAIWIRVLFFYGYTRLHIFF